MFKNIIILSLLMCSVVSCATNQQKNVWWEKNGKLKVLTTIAMIEDIVQDIGGPWVDTISLVRGELDPHSYELVKGDDEKFAIAHLVFYNGLGLEHSLSLRNKLSGLNKAIAVTDAIVKNHGDLILYADGQMDPHVWMDISLWAQIVDPIAEALCCQDPHHQEYYVSRAAEVKERLLSKDREIYQSLQAIDSKKRILITSHDAFHYFTRRYLAAPGEEQWHYRCAAPEGLAPDAQLSLNDIYTVLKIIETYQVSVVFPESNLSADCLNKLVQAGKQRGLEVVLSRQALHGDSMGQSAHYLDMMQHNATVIARALAGSS